MLTAKINKDYLASLDKRKRRLEKRQLDEDKKLEEQAKRDLETKLQNMSNGWDMSGPPSRLHYPVMPSDAPPDPSDFPALGSGNNNARSSNLAVWPKLPTAPPRSARSNRIQIDWNTKPKRKVGKKTVLLSSAMGPNL